ncbi:MAG: hypothetical protein QM535_20285 [Limnohabitans sp.]|nr:hypothetical protein [Limnohabitans sp.]
MRKNIRIGCGTHYDFGARYYDSRIGKIGWSKDPLTDKYPYESPYVFAGNNPIYFIDKNGEYKVSNAEVLQTYQEKYPQIMKYFETKIKDDVLGSNKIKTALGQFWKAKTGRQLSDEYLENHLLAWGKGPDIEFDNAPGNVVGANGTYDAEINTITLNSEHAAKLNYVLENEPSISKREEEFLKFFMTIIHESGHKMNYPDVIDDKINGVIRRPMHYEDGREQIIPGVESGDVVEKSVWGYEGYDPTNKYDSNINDKSKPGIIRGIINYFKDRKADKNTPSPPNKSHKGGSKSGPPKTCIRT